MAQGLVLLRYELHYLAVGSQAEVASSLGVARFAVVILVRPHIHRSLAEMQALHCQDPHTY